MVQGVCRRVLGDDHDAEDAFQATFLVLARKGAALDRRGSVGGWLFTVAYHLALRSRAGAARRQALERQAQLMSRPEACTTDPALRPLLDQELSRLPENYRAPLVLCYFEGLSNEEAAEQLGWPAGTVKGRLARARELLRRRLSRRGLSLSVAALAPILTDQAAAAAVSTQLIQTTTQAALQFAAGQALTGPAVVLAEGGLQAMTISKLKIAAALVVGVIAVGSAGAIAQRALGSRPVAAVATPVDTSPSQPEAKADEELLAALRACELVITAKIARVTPMGQTNSVPPSIFGTITFQDVKVLTGKVPADPTFDYRYRNNEAGMRHLDLSSKELVLAGISGNGVRVIVPASEANLAAAKQASAAAKADEKLVAALKDDTAVIFTAKIDGSVSIESLRIKPPIPVALIIKLKDVQALRGPAPAQRFRCAYQAELLETLGQLSNEPILVVASPGDFPTVHAVVAATEANVQVAKQAVAAAEKKDGQIKRP
jgi:RNA polymerase sigma factor (sigma-70 family)